MTAKRILIALLLAIVPLQAFALSSDELLALVAMPLAVAAVSEVTGVPLPELANVAATLNAANVPPVQFVQTMRYIPAALVVEVPDQPRFVQWVDTRYDQGITGLALVNDIEHQLPVYGIPSSEITVSAPALPPLLPSDGFFPPVVTTRVQEARNHPHGGPPGQLKKELGLQTGAEVVHGEHPGRGAKARREDDDRYDRSPRVTRRDDDRPGKASKGEKHGRAREVKKGRDVSDYVAPARANGHGKPAHAGGKGGHGNPHGGGGGKGHGKGKG